MKYESCDNEKLTVDDARHNQRYVEEFYRHPDWSKVAPKDWNRVYELLILIPTTKQRQELATPERELLWQWETELLELTGADIVRHNAR